MLPTYRFDIFPDAVSRDTHYWFFYPILSDSGFITISQCLYTPWERFIHSTSCLYESCIQPAAMPPAQAREGQFNRCSPLMSQMTHLNRSRGLKVTNKPITMHQLHQVPWAAVGKLYRRDPDPNFISSNPTVWAPSSASSRAFGDTWPLPRKVHTLMIQVWSERSPRDSKGLL